MASVKWGILIVENATVIKKKRIVVTSVTPKCIKFCRNISKEELIVVSFGILISMILLNVIFYNENSRATLKY